MFWTGPTVVTPLIQQIKLASPLGDVLEAEGLVLEPIGAVLALLLLELLVGDLHGWKELVFGLLSVGYIYRNYSYDDEDYDDDYEDDYDDTQYQELDEFDNTQQSAATELEPSPQIQEPEVQVPVGVAEPVQVAETTSVAPVQEFSPEVKTRKKWFGLFGPRIPVDPPETGTAVSQPVAAEPVVAQPVTAEPVVAQPVAAEPVVAEAVVISEAEDET